MVSLKRVKIVVESFSIFKDFPVLADLWYNISKLSRKFNADENINNWVKQKLYKPKPNRTKSKIYCNFMFLFYFYTFNKTWVHLNNSPNMCQWLVGWSKGHMGSDWINWSKNVKFMWFPWQWQPIILKF